MPITSFARALAPDPATRRARPAVASLLATSLLLLGGCGGNDGNTDGPPPIPASVGLSPAATVSRSGSLVLEQQDRSSTAGAQISQSPRYTLINEGVTP